MNEIIQIKWKFRVVCQNWGEKLMSNLFHIWFLVCRHFYRLYHWIFTAKIFEQSRLLLIFLWNYINLILSTKTNVINYLNSLLTPSTNTLSTSERVFECNSLQKKIGVDDSSCGLFLTLDVFGTSTFSAKWFLLICKWAHVNVLVWYKTHFQQHFELIFFQF